MKEGRVNNKGKGWLGFIVGFVAYVIVWSDYSISLASASVHDYGNQPFTTQSNAFFFHGGSEGLYASKLHQSSPDKPYKGHSFIRYLHYLFIGSFLF